MVKEYTFEEYVSALCGWALFAQNALHDRKYSEVEKNIGFLVSGISKVQWRKGVGIRDLPSMPETRSMHMYLDRAEAAIHKLSELGHELEGMVSKSDAEKQLLKDKLSPLLGILYNMTFEAQKIVKSHPWENPHLLVMPVNKALLQMLFSKKGFYGKMDAPHWISLIHRLPLMGCDLSGMNLSGLPFAGANLAGANLKKTNLSNCLLQHSILSYSFLAGANFKGANVDGAVFTGAKGLVVGQVLQMINVSKTIGIVPPETKAKPTAAVYIKAA